MATTADIEISRKLSILSVLSNKFAEERKVSHKHDNAKGPKDFMFAVHIACFFVGFMNVMPMVFFSTANSYWMYKFRNVTQGDEITQGQDRTRLQVYFQPALMAGGTIPSVICTILWTFYGHKIASMLRSLAALVLLGLVFAIFAIFTQINTDSWQTGFFALTVILLMMNSAGVATFQMSSVILIAKLPPSYMFCYLIGQNGTVLTTSLQLVAVAVTNNSITSGLIYFTAGTTLITISLMFVMIARRSHVFRYYEVENIKDKHAEHIKFDEMKKLIVQLWPVLVVIGILFFTLSFVHPSITTLVESEYAYEKTAWTQKFFTPTLVFLLAEVASIVGRLLSHKFLITHSNKWWYILCLLVRLICTPFYLFCNAQPRTHLPVIFDHDWEFVLGHIILSSSTGFLMHVGFMSVRSLAEGKTEVGLKIVTLTLSLVSAASTFNGFLTVMLL
ncbi:equilibrative nucleoside transporter 3 isoform X4 [Diabrotica virgifera virgifera]|uniref:Equilibrative nucleoside transporter 3-like n=1 Tax=Diabrotica virgifera virgifera TaxID=50390 RepID=A0ABM5KP03_DIAVI|nr:equilibrative nucleoside transporter 3 isoform X1 [Diabrotica virgifera virgifera]XP_050511927.1 equilibrative nucleoside transporter 3 isoform X3 [Diabrotica virgifera virgifera]XP_050511928.1 equilibrative nucleoside transporter 3 isoform X4 [Diabrotica virgifera virgifera]